jgi:hypothetical protein
VLQLGVFCVQVAQEQLAEYATEKSSAASAVLHQAEALESTLQQLLAASTSSSSSADASAPAATHAVAAAMQQLKAQLEQAAVEAQAFAEQQLADVERAKRSSAQVGHSYRDPHMRAGCTPAVPALRPLMESGYQTVWYLESMVGCSAGLQE